MDIEAFFNSGEGQAVVLNVALVEWLRFGPPAGHTDLDVTIALTRLLHYDFVCHGTDGKGGHLDDDNVPIVIKAHRAVLERLALEPPAWPFRTFDGPRGFGTYWRDNGMSGSRKARRDRIEQILGPTRDALEDLQELDYERQFAKEPSGSFKNLIFAADGEKPELVLRNAVNNDVEIVRNAHTCLVFTDLLPPQGLTWRQMVAW
ncbi:hypothetical protein ABZ527_36475 [Streptomyces griseofuscus]|uniref:hypothetical protein n=1 Tax=Streptomyces griseofuscus TaxID=146922 RepID=UPI003404BCAA